MIVTVGFRAMARSHQLQGHKHFHQPSVWLENLFKSRTSENYIRVSWKDKNRIFSLESAGCFLIYFQHSLSLPGVVCFY